MLGLCPTFGKYPHCPYSLIHHKQDQSCWAVRITLHFSYFSTRWISLSFLISRNICWRRWILLWPALSSISKSQVTRFKNRDCLRIFGVVWSAWVTIWGSFSRNRVRGRGYHGLPGILCSSCALAAEGVFRITEMSLFPAKERSASFLHTIMKKEKVPPKTLCHHHLGHFFLRFNFPLHISHTLPRCTLLLSHPLTFNSCPLSPPACLSPWLWW